MSRNKTLLSMPCTVAGIKSRIIGKIDWEPTELTRTQSLIDRMPISPAYGDYASGKWGSVMLANKSGKKDDGLSVEYRGSARLTEYGREVPYLMKTIDEVFDLDFAKSVRIFLSGDGGQIFTHRDYMEFVKGFTRVHLPIRTSDGCMNSEGAWVYHMNVGEVCFLDGHLPHSAVAYTKKSRLHVVIDFDPDVEFINLFRDKAAYRVDTTPTLIQRPLMSEEQRERLVALGSILTHENFRDVHGLLNRQHFHFDMNAADTYGLLMDVAMRSGDESLIGRADETRVLFLGPED
jgi:hypothetical protein